MSKDALRLVAISDTHGFHKDIMLPKGDVLIHAGDACMNGNEREFLDFINWFGRQPFKRKIFVPGNHDFFVQESLGIANILCVERDIAMLIDRMIRVDDVVFYGSPWVPKLSTWAFYANSGRLVEHFSRIPEFTDVLITHGPPHGVGDDCGVHAGSSELHTRVLGLNLKAHIWGHIHEGYGRHNYFGRDRATRGYNVACCTREYVCSNPPTVIDVL